jgi:hypothetical protein
MGCAPFGVAGLQGRLRRAKIGAPPELRTFLKGLTLLEE